MKWALAFFVTGLSWVGARAAVAQPAPRANPFGCLGEGEALTRGLGSAQMRDEVQRRVAAPPAADEPRDEVARYHCVTAELMRRVGDRRADEYYRKAIAAAPSEPGYELWYGYYLRNVRGPGHPLDEAAELHYFRVLEKLDGLRATGALQDFDQATLGWARRGLISLYQEDGLPILPGKAYPYQGRRSNEIGLALTSILRGSRDTNGFGEVDDVRRFTSEAAFASSAERLDRPLDRDELKGIVRTPNRLGFFNRLRLRLPPVGSFDLSYNVFRAPKSQITYFTEPNNFGDVSVNEAAVGYRRAFDLYPLFDLLVDVGYRRVQRTGVVEWFPKLRENINMFEAHPVVSRSVGPDKLTVGMNYVFMDIPQVPGGPTYDRVRERAIRAYWIDYAIYRPLLLPDLSTMSVQRTLTRGWHFYGGAALDDEAYGVRTAMRRDFYAGTSLRGIGKFDVTLQGTMFKGDTSYAQRDQTGTVQRLEDASQANTQVRPTFVLLYRILDDEAIPDIPRTPLAGLNLVVPVRHDFATRGSNLFENTRAGVELWSKVISTGMRGTSFLITAGYDAQYFHRLKVLEHTARLELRMGWGTL